MKTMKVKVTGPIVRNSDGCILSVSRPAFINDPDRVFTVPDNKFWRELITAGRMVDVKAHETLEPEKKRKPRNG